MQISGFRPQRPFSKILFCPTSGELCRDESNVPSISLVDEYAFKAWAPLYII